MSLTLTIPGKTFLAGEYLALSGGPALVVSTKPEFWLEAKLESKFEAKNETDPKSKPESENQAWAIKPDWHPQSPAGAFINAHRDFFSNISLNFVDGYEGRGGFGASTAQFLSVYVLAVFQKPEAFEMQPLLDYRHMLSEYEKYAWSGEGAKPSGADLIGQLKGSLTFFDKNQGLISVKSWPFPELDFLLISTGQKLPTHEHLKSLPEFDNSGLLKAFKKIQQAFELNLSADLVQGVNEYAQELQNLEFTCEPTIKKLNALRALPRVLAAKGCGALGADVILVVCSVADTERVQTEIFAQGLKTIATSKEISPGLQIKGTL